MFTPEQVAMLKAPLGSSHVKTRKQAGRDLSYIEGWYAIAEANRIFGHDCWSRYTTTMQRCGEPREIDGKWRVAFMAQVRIEVVLTGDGAPKNVTREGTGYGSGIDRDLGSAHESAIKEAETDAMKRALMTFGNPFGLALYDKEQAGVVDDAKPAPAQVAPKPPAADPDAKARAIKWAGEAIEAVNWLRDSKKFDAWHKENRERVARVKEYDARLHEELTGLIREKLDAFNPIGAG